MLTESKQIYIPADCVGAIIGHGGQRNCDIRQQTQTAIKIAEQADGSKERLVTVQGATQESVQQALVMIYQHLETEKARLAAAAATATGGAAQA